MRGKSIAYDIPLQWIAEVTNMIKLNQCLKRVKDSIEELIMVVQGHASKIRPIEAQIYHTRKDPKYRLCKNTPKTIQHLTKGCKIIAEKESIKIASPSGC